MERQLDKTKRVLSCQPNKNPTDFARKYTAYLLPALKKINMAKPSSEIDGGDRHERFGQTVKHEVDMALALSAQEFAWSRFLQQKLSPSDASTSRSSQDSSNSGKILDGIQLERSDEEEEEEEEEEVGGGEISKRLRELQKLLPGGDEMGEEEMLSEIGSYIVCLEMQMIVLKSLVQVI